jgi:anthranilate synthase component 1
MSVRQLATGVDLLDLACRCPERYPHLLDTALVGQAPARFSILFAFPGDTLACDGPGVLDQLAVLGPFDTLTETGHGASLPFVGGWFLYLGYELAWDIEPALGSCSSDPWLPRAVLTRFPAALIQDHLEGIAYFVDEDADPERWRQVQADLEASIEDADRTAPELQIEEDPPEPYREAVRRALAYIRDGDCFQANLSREWRAVADRRLDAGALYGRLRRTNPAPFAALLRLPGAEIISSSPERLVSVRDGMVETRPIAGTRRRDPDSLKDSELSIELKVNSKENAEHVMLVDLERNDLGRVCVPGTVVVPELMTIESYRRVHHIVSSVRGRLTPGTTPGDVIRATFPGGTITGCPKIRSMQIIQELEGGVARGAYTGSCGYISRNGHMDTNILIRTLVVRGRELRFRAGAGIVSDSLPEFELEETRHKAHALLDALQA